MPLRIGVVDQTAAGWTAASIYSQMMLRSLDSACQKANIKLYFLSANAPGADLAVEAEWIQLAVPKSPRRRGEARLRNLLGRADNSNTFSVGQKNRIDVLLPLLDVPPWRVSPKLIGWIPDLQHVYLPELFSGAELQKRNATIHRLIERAALIMLSSKAARDDLLAFAPPAAEKARVLPFPSLLAFESLSETPESTRTKFNLPLKFALVANQFWEHKNHQVVVSAAARLRDRGMTVAIVMTGLPVDHRDRDNSNLSSLLQAIASAGLSSQITILGQVPYADLVNLMRTATVVIQPSRFEGWSTIVQDAKALGRPVICSDIAVHREQAPGSLGFFPAGRPDVLAELLEEFWDKLEPGPNLQLEPQALATEREFAHQHGRTLITLCREACA